MEPHQETGQPLSPRQSRNLDEDNRYVQVLPTSFHCQEHGCHVSDCHDCHVNDLPMPVSGGMGRTDAELKEEKYLRNEVQDLTRNLESCTEERDTLVVESGEFQKPLQIQPHQETGHPLTPRQSRSLDEDNRYVKGRYYMFVEVFTQTYRCIFPIIPWVCFLYDIPNSGRLIFSAILVILYIVCKMEPHQEIEVQELTRKLESCTEERDDYKGQLDALVIESGVFQQRIQVFQDFVNNMKEFNIIEGTNIIVGDGNTMRVNEENLHEVLTKLIELKRELDISKLSLEELAEGVKKLIKSVEEGHTKTDTIKANVHDLMELVSDRPVLKVYRECLHSLRDLKDNPQFQQGQFKFDDLPDQHAKSGVKRMAATLDESMWMQAAVRFGVNKKTLPATETDLAKRKLTIYAHLLYRWVCMEPDKTEEDLIDIIEELQRERNKETRKRLEATMQPKFKPAPPQDTNQFKEVDTKLCQMVPMVKQILDQMNRFGEVMEGIDERTKKPNEGKDISFPEHWDPMEDGEYIKLVMLKPTDPEYQQLEKHFMGQVKKGDNTARIQFDVSKIKIDKIERVQNEHLWQQYVVRKAKIEKEKPTLPADMKPLERKVWHGTTAVAAINIVSYGVNISNGGVKDTWSGVGVYFDSDASYSVRRLLSGAQNTGPIRGCVFSVRAVTGHYTKGYPNMRFLPPIHPAKQLILFDSAVDNVQNPVVFVIFHDTQTYPEYLITFSAN